MIVINCPSLHFNIIIFFLKTGLYGIPSWLARDKYLVDLLETMYLSHWPCSFPGDLKNLPIPSVRQCYNRGW